MSMGADSASSRFEGFAAALGAFEYPLDADGGVSGVDGWVEDFAR
jgi:hypothetical protein